MAHTARHNTHQAQTSLQKTWQPPDPSGFHTHFEKKQKLHKLQNQKHQENYQTKRKDSHSNQQTSRPRRLSTVCRMSLLKTLPNQCQILKTLIVKVKNTKFSNAKVLFRTSNQLCQIVLWVSKVFIAKKIKNHNNNNLKPVEIIKKLFQHHLNILKNV